MSELYDSWREISAKRAGMPAVFAPVAGWLSFRQLAEMVEARPGTKDAMVFPAGGGVEFLLTLLQGWRDGSVIMPLDGARPEHLCPREICQEMGVAHIKLTSGTTGLPRQVLFRPSQLRADVDNICATMGLDPDLPNVGAISLAHSFGFSNLVLPLLLKGIPLVLASDALPESVRRALGHAGECTLPAVPAMWRAWAAAGVLSGKIRTAISAGAPLPIELERAVYESEGLKIRNFYGSSECGGIAFDRTAEPRTDATLAGSVLDNVKVEVDSAGRLLVRSNAVAQGYWPQWEEGGLSQGKFLTSDLAECFSGGIRLLGRATDMINIAGRKLSPLEVENALSSCAGVRACVVFGVPSADATRGEEVAAVLRLEGVALDAVKREAARRLSPWQLPRHWWCQEEGLENQRGKISRSEWKARFLARAQ